MYFTLGVEEEYQILDAQTLELASHDQRIVEVAEGVVPGQVKAEMHQAVVEVGTTVCNDVKEVAVQIKHLRSTISQIAKQLGFKIGAAGTHPTSEWAKQLITPNTRYLEIVDELQDAARSNLIFGLHVHVGIPDRNMALHIANSIRYFLPHIYAISTNSPFWEGRNTGFKSFRSKVFDKFPRTGIPDYFESVPEYDRYVNLLIKTQSIDNARKIWWDVRVHSIYPTIEIRICDIPLTCDETVALTALIQAIAVKLFKLREANLNFIMYRRALLMENKWRAGRYGIEGKMIDFGKEIETDTKGLIKELLDFVDDVVDELDSRDAINYIYKILEMGTGADRQLKVYHETGDLRKVTEFIVEETIKGL